MNGIEIDPNFDIKQWEGYEESILENFKNAFLKGQKLRDRVREFGTKEYDALSLQEKETLSIYLVVTGLAQKQIAIEQK